MFRVALGKIKGIKSERFTISELLFGFADVISCSFRCCGVQQRCHFLQEISKQTLFCHVADCLQESKQSIRHLCFRVVAKRTGAHVSGFDRVIHSKWRTLESELRAFL